MSDNKRDKNTFAVTTQAHNGYEMEKIITADDFNIDRGILVFNWADGNYAAAFPDGVWTKVVQINV